MPAWRRKVPRRWAWNGNSSWSDPETRLPVFFILRNITEESCLYFSTCIHCKMLIEFRRHITIVRAFQVATNKAKWKMPSTRYKPFEYLEMFRLVCISWQKHLSHKKLQNNDGIQEYLNSFQSYYCSNLQGFALNFTEQVIFGCWKTIVRNGNYMIMRWNAKRKFWHMFLWNILSTSPYQVYCGYKCLLFWSLGAMKDAHILVYVFASQKIIHVNLSKLHWARLRKSKNANGTNETTNFMPCVRGLWPLPT